MTAGSLQELRVRDYARYLSLWLIAPEHRALALALFDLEAELLAIPAKVTDPTLGLLRIVWWRDAVTDVAASKVKAHPVLQALQQTMPDTTTTAAIAEWVETYDLPFLEAAEQTERLERRAAMEADLFGALASYFTMQARKGPKSSRLGLLWRLIVKIIHKP